MAVEVDVALMKRKDNQQVVGVSVVAQPQTEAEIFCASLPKLLVARQADIRVDRSTLVISHPQLGDVRRSLSTTDAAELNNLLESDGTKWGLYHAPSAFMTPGFMLVPEPCKDIVEEFKLNQR